MRHIKPNQLPRWFYDALPYLYACLGIGLLYELGSGIAFVMGFVLLVAAILVAYMRSSARQRAYLRALQRKRRMAGLD